MQPGGESLTPGSQAFDLRHGPSSGRRTAFRIIHWFTIALVVIFAAILAFGIFVNVVYPGPGEANAIPGFVFLVLIFALMAYMTGEGATTLVLDPFGAEFLSKGRKVLRFDWVGGGQTLRINLPGTSPAHPQVRQGIVTPNRLGRPIWLGPDVYEAIVSQVGRRGLQVEWIQGGMSGAPVGGSAVIIHSGDPPVPGTVVVPGPPQSDYTFQLR